MKISPIIAVSSLIVMLVASLAVNAAQNPDINTGFDPAALPVWTQSPSANQAAGAVSRADRHTRGMQKAIEPTLGSALNRSPGVYIGDTGQAARRTDLSIRGFKAGAGPGVQVLVNGIPESMNGGDTLNEKMPSAGIGQVEIRRQPDSSSRAGSGDGRVIDITTLAPEAGPLDRAALSTGNNGYREFSLSSARRYKHWGYAGTASRFHRTGYRQHSETTNNEFIGKLTRDVGTSGRLRLITDLIDAPDNREPGSLTREAVKADRRAADPDNIGFNARQSATQETIGAIYDGRLDKRQTYRTRAYYTHRDFSSFLPVLESGVNAYQRDFFGGGLQGTRSWQAFGYRNQTMFGVDFELQQDHRRNHDNNAGNRGALTFDQEETATGAGIFMQNTLSVRPSLSLHAGLRYDWLGFIINDRFVTPSNPDDSGSRRYSRLSAHVGVDYSWRKRQHVYASVANGFQAPTIAGFAKPSGQGGFNPNVVPQQTFSYEVGAEGAIGRRGHYRLDAFLIDVSNELVVFYAGTKRDFYENAGRTRHMGIESQIRYDLGFNIQATVACALASYRFRQFTDANGSNDAGKRIPGLPEQTVFGELAWRHPTIGAVMLDASRTGSLVADNANTVAVASHTVVNLTLGRTIKTGQNKLSVSVGLDNLFNVDYDENIRSNASDGQYYEPAPRRTFYVGLAYAL